MIPVNKPIFGAKEKELLIKCIDEKWLSSGGRFVKEFEERFSQYIGVDYGIAVSSGTAALEVALKALNLKKGDEVIMPAFTIISPLLAVIRTGAVPVLVDSEKDTWNMAVSRIEAKITKRTRAILPVHIYGHPVDMEPIMDLSKKYGLFVIEDAAEAHGAEYGTKRCGSIGAISAFSFYANKIITTGEGGMVLTNDKDLSERARSLRNLCFRAERRFYHTELGYNYRMSNLQAAVGLAQFEKIDQFIAIKRKNAEQYNHLLKGLSYLHLPVEKEWAKNVYWVYGIVLDKGLNLEAKEFSMKLLNEGIETRPFFLGMHRQPALNKLGLFKGENYPIADYLSNKGLYLPSGLGLTRNQIYRVCRTIRKILSR